MTVLLGTLSTGGAGDVFASGDLAATKRTASASGNVDTMRATLATSAGATVTFVLYADSSGPPGSLLGQTNAVAVSAGTVSALMLTPVAVTSGTAYWVGFLVLGAGLNLTDNTPGGYSGNKSNASPPTPFGTITFNDATNSLPVTGEDTGIAATQTVLPDADIDTTGWSTAPLFSKINDASDATVITSTI